MIKVSQVSKNKTIHYQGILARAYQDKENEFAINIIGYSERVGLILDNKDLESLYEKIKLALNK